MDGMKVIAVDVGTSSVRLAIISFNGLECNEAHVIASREREVSYHQNGVQFEQSSSEIWRAICECSSSCIREANIDPSYIRSIAFSSTCSLVIADAGSDYLRDIIMWMDHRAIKEAREVTLGGSKVLDQFGGVCSPEFSLAKLLWLSKHQPNRLAAAKALFELPDWLVYKCIRGDPADCPRSLCSLTCKWGYDASENKHCDIIEAFELELRTKSGTNILKPGTVAGKLSLEAAIELGLLAAGTVSSPDLSISVATSLIDAHSGTSTCHMLLSERRNFTPGIWGPYKDVVLDGYNLLEAGQSLTGKLIEICIERSHEGKQMLAGGVSMKMIIQKLNEEINDKNRKSALHILPTYHGSRSPLANPRLKGGIYGLTAEGEASLLELYIATVESIVFETRSIVEVLGIELSAILVSGGLMKNKFYMQTLADVLKCKAIKMSLQEVDFMVMGSGLIARWAALSSSEVLECNLEGRPLNAESIAGIEYGQLDIDIYEPDESRDAYFDRKYACYKEFADFSRRVDTLLNA